MKNVWNYYLLFEMGSFQIPKDGKKVIKIVIKAEVFANRARTRAFRWK